MKEYGDATDVIGPTGGWLTKVNLSGARTHRRAFDHKARIFAVIDGGQMSRDEVLMRHALGEEAFESWKALMSRHDSGPIQLTRPRYLRAVRS